MVIPILEWPLVSLLVFFPLVGAFLCLTPLFSAKYDSSGRIVRAWAICTSALTLGFLVKLSNFIGGGEPVNAASVLGVHEVHPWMPSFGVSFSFLLDGLSYVFCLLTAIVSLVVILWSSRSSAATGRAWYSVILAAEGGVMGAFLATDLLLFYVFYELMLLPVLIGIGLWGGIGRIQAVFKFAIYTLAGSVLMFLAILYCGWKARVAGVVSFDVFELVKHDLFSPQEQIFLGAAFVLAFAVKIPMVPFHSWLPDAYREAPHGIAAFVAALLGKVGIYGILRFAWPLFPLFIAEYGHILAACGAIGVAYGALIALQQKDLRLLLAYSSISHLGFCVLGLATNTPTAVAGAIFQSFSHGIVTAALFLLFGVLIDARKSANFFNFGGLAARLPRNAFFLMVFSLAAVALPLTSSFVGEFMILLGSYSKYPLWTLLATSGVVLGAVYTLTAYLRLMFGADRCTDVTSKSDVSSFDTAILAALAAIVVVLGVYPRPVLALLEPAVMNASQSDTERQK